MSLEYTKGSTDVSIDIKIIDDTDGTPELGVLFDAAGMDLRFRREGSAVVNITEVTLAALTTAHTDGGFLEIGFGYYRLDVPDAAFAAGQNGVLIFGTVTGMVIIGEYVQLVDYDPFDAVRMGMTALPNAAADAALGLPISDAGGLDMDAMRDAAVRLTAARAQILTDWIDAGRLDALLDAIPTTAMRGTNNAALAAVCTEARLAELAAANLPSDIDALITTLGASGAGLTDITDRLPAALIKGTADSGSTTTLVDSDLNQSSSIHWPGQWLRLTSGAMTGQVRLITAFSQINDELTVAPAFSASVSTETYEILPAAAIDVRQWLGATVNALIAGAVDADVSALQPGIITATEAPNLDAAVSSRSSSSAVSNVQSDTDDIQSRLPATLVGGRIDASVGALAANVITAAAINAAAFTAAKFATDAVDANAFAADAAQKIRDEILPTQNVALDNIMFLLVAASDHVTPVTAATGLAVTRAIDGGAFGDGTGTLTEVANGMYQYDASAADMNGGIITFRFVATGGSPGAADDRFLTIITGGGV